MNKQHSLSIWVSARANSRTRASHCIATSGVFTLVLFLSISLSLAVFCSFVAVQNEFRYHMDGVDVLVRARLTLLLFIYLSQKIISIASAYNFRFVRKNIQMKWTTTSTVELNSEQTKRTKKKMATANYIDANGRKQHTRATINSHISSTYRRVAKNKNTTQHHPIELKFGFYFVTANFNI